MKTSNIMLILGGMFAGLWYVGMWLILFTPSLDKHIDFINLHAVLAFFLLLFAGVFQWVENYNFKEVK